MNGRVSMLALVALIAGCGGGGGPGSGGNTEFVLDADREMRRVAGLVRSQLTGPFAMISPTLQFGLHLRTPDVAVACPDGGTWMPTVLGTRDYRINMDGCAFAGTTASGALEYFGVSPAGEEPITFDRMFADIDINGLQFELEVLNGRVAPASGTLEVGEFEGFLTNAESPYRIAEVDFRQPINYAQGVSTVRAFDAGRAAYSSNVVVLNFEDPAALSFSYDPAYPLLVFGIPADVAATTAYSNGNVFISGDVLTSGGSGTATFEDDVGSVSDSTTFSWVDVYANAIYSLNP